MKTYNVFYSAKAGVDRTELEKLTHEFVVQLEERLPVESVNFHTVSNKGNFPEMPDYQVAVNFSNQQQMDESFKIVRGSLMNQYPHLELMKQVRDFKVTFSEY